jgi:heme exporter protein A
MILKIQNLSCRRGDRLLFENLDFQIQSGELLFIEGHNGCGKTTLLKTLATLRRPDAGVVLWDEQSIFKLADEYRQNLVWLGHYNGLKGDLTALENLRIASVLNGINASEDTLWEALKTIGLYGFEDLPTTVLSQGQKRRAALSYLLLTKAPLWILDEPFSALDVRAVDMLQAIIARHVEQGGMVILTTHQEVPLTSGQVKRLKLAA